MSTSNRAMSIGILAMLAFGSHASAVDRFWTGGTGAYLTGTNWSGNAIPTSGDNAFINNGGTAQLSGGTGEASQFNVGSALGTTGSYQQTGGVHISNKTTFGEGGSATATLSGGELQVGGGSLFVGGENNLGTGVLNLTGPGVVVTSGDDIQFGRVGNGTLNFQAGLMKGGYTVVGKFGTGTWNHSGGVFDQDFGDIEIGDGGKPDQVGEPGPRVGTINLSGGVIQTGDGFAIGNRVGTGTVNISGGGLAVTGNGTSSLWVGRGLDWEFEPNSGAHTSLRITGGQAVIAVNDSFLMNPDQVALSSTLIANITGASHSTIQVGGSADITNGSFKVELTGYTPLSGQSWTLIHSGADLTTATAQIDAIVAAGNYPALTHAAGAGSGSRIGTFTSTDLTASLPAGLSWAVSYTTTDVILRVTGTLKGDFDNNGAFQCADVDPLVATIAAGTNVVSFDMTGDGLVNGADLTSWLRNAGAANLANRHSYLLGDANLDGSVDGSDFGIWNSNKFTNQAAWCKGDFNANGAIDGSDFGIWNSNKFTSADSSSGSLVPEPTSCGALALLALLGAAKARRNRR